MILQINDFFFFLEEDQKTHLSGGCGHAIAVSWAWTHVGALFQLGPGLPVHVG